MNHQMTGFEDHLAFREQMLRMGVIAIAVDYSGSGDSMDHFDVVYKFEGPIALDAEAMLLEAKRIQEDTKSWSVDNIDGYAREAAKASLASGEAHGTHKLSAIYALKSGQKSLNVDWDDLMYAIASAAGAVMMFDNDGSSGTIEWDLKTNICDISSGYYETTRDDAGSYSDVFGAADAMAELEAAGIETPTEGADA